MGSALKNLFKKENSTEDEIKQLVEEDEQVGQLEKNQREMINNIFEFDDLDAGDIMTHRIDINAVDCNSNIEDAVKLAIEYGNSRLPVYDGDLDNICGILYVKDLLKFVGNHISPDEKLLSYIRKPLYVPESMPGGKLFAKMTETRIMLAIVIDEYGGTAGLVTMEDILEEIVGEIWDERDEEIDEFQKIGNNVYKVLCTASLDDFREYFKLDDEEELDVTTVNGWITEVTGIIPEAGYTFDYKNLTVTIVKADQFMTHEIRVEVHPQEENIED